LLAALFLIALSASPTISLASPPAQIAPQSVAIPAGGTVTIKVRGFCLVFGRPFPTGNMSINGLASDVTRNALTYAIQKGYTDSNAAQVQEAIWYLQDNTWHSDEHVIGQEIVDNASTVTTIPEGSGTALSDTTVQDVLTMTAIFIPQTADAFYGDGDLQVTNTGSTDTTVFLPIGAKFVVPDNSGGFQDLVVYALQPAGGTPTAAATGTATSPATATAAATSTSAPIATTAPATPTSQAVTAPTDTPAPVATATLVSSALPATGNPHDIYPIGWLLVALGCGVTILRLFMDTRRRNR
jgi:hypothetical protein